MSTVHPKVDRLIFQCSKSKDCKKIFSQPFQLKLHEKRHDMLNPKQDISCDQCHDNGTPPCKRFMSLNQLRSHEKAAHKNSITFNSAQNMFENNCTEDKDLSSNRSKDLRN